MSSHVHVVILKDHQKIEETIRECTLALKIDVVLDWSRRCAHITRGLAYRDLGRIEEAIAEFDAAIRLGDVLGKALFCRAETYEEAGSFQQAAADYRILANLGFEKVSRDRKDEARERLRELESSSGGSVPAVVNEQDGQD